MNPNVFALSEALTAGEAITALQTARDVEMVFYLYAVDDRRHLVGVVSLRQEMVYVKKQSPESQAPCVAGSRFISSEGSCVPLPISRAAN